MKSPLVDITTFNGIQSLFSGKRKDPWAYKLAGKFADAFIYSENIRYAKPILDEHAKTPILAHEPSILIELESKDTGFFKPVEYSSKEPRELQDDYLRDSFEKFSVWVRNNPETTNAWISLHNEKWIRDRRPIQNEGYVFSINKLKRSLPFLALAREINSDIQELCHVFDVVLRGPIYGELAGENEHYLNHPIRNIFTLPTMEVIETAPPKISISFEEVVTNLAKSNKFNEKEYALLLHNLRGYVWDKGLNKLNPGEIDLEVIREIAEKVEFPPRIKDVGKIAIAASGALTALGALVGPNPIAAIVGATITVSPLLWKGYLPRSTGKIKWFRWALKYDIENQTKDRNL